MKPTVVSVHRSSRHDFTKPRVDQLELHAGLGVEGDAHMGARVKHRSRVEADPNQPNLRQVSFLPREILDGVAGKGFEVSPGDLGENISTAGLDLFALPTGTVLRLGDTALVALTGLRNPCGQINGFADGLLGALIERDDEGKLLRRGGVMSVVLLGGTVRAGDAIAVALPPEPHVEMERV